MSPQNQRMRLWVSALWLLLFGANLSVCRGQTPAAFTVPATCLVRQFNLLLDLGNEDPYVRRDALLSLRGKGAGAWDCISLGCNFSDPEISVTCRRLLEQIPFEEELSKHVSWIGNYRQANHVHRERIIVRLGQVGDVDAQIALALLTRFERDDHLARLAALELVTGQYQPIADLNNWVGLGTGPASQWLRVHAATAGRIQGFTESWGPLVKTLASDPWCEKQPRHALRLFRWYTTELLIRGRKAELQWSLEQTLRFVVNQPTAVIETLDWLLINDQIQASERLLARYPELEKEDPRLVFRRAEIIRLQGDGDRARKLVERCCTEKAGLDAPKQVQCAIHLKMAGLQHWSALLLDRLKNDGAVAASIQIQASLLAAECHYELGEYSEAATAIREVMQKTSNKKEDNAVILLPLSLQSQHSLYGYLAARQQGDWETARNILLDGLEVSPSDSRLLIAMVRHSDPGWSAEHESAWQAKSAEMVGLALSERMHKIRVLRIDYEVDARQSRIRKNALRLELNRYAWLASQTGTDLRQAEDFAREAYALAPTDGNVLDTLAACLFARGNLKEAMLCQTQAFRQAPWSPQIRAGLAQYKRVASLTGVTGLIR